MAVSNAFRSAIQAQETAEEILTLVEIRHALLDTRIWPDGINIVNDVGEVTSRGRRYLPCTFEVPWPDQAGDEPPRLQAVIAADARVRDALRSIDSPAEVTLLEVLRSQPDVVDQGPISLQLSRTRMTAETVTGDLTLFPALEQRFPRYSMTPQRRPGLF